MKGAKQNKTVLVAAVLLTLSCPSVCMDQSHKETPNTIGIVSLRGVPRLPVMSEESERSLSVCCGLCTKKSEHDIIEAPCCGPLNREAVQDGALAAAIILCCTLCPH